MSHGFHYAEYQNGIYAAGLQGETPTLPMPIEDLEAHAFEELQPEAYGYVAGGAGGETTMHANLDAFDDWRIVPRMLRDVSKRDLSTNVLGTAMGAPLMLAPIGVQTIVHEDGELATARGAKATGVPMILSTASTKNMEEVAEALGDTPRWYQLYWPKDPALAKSFVQRAEKAGYGAIVVTLDTKLLAWREADLEHAYLPFLRGEGIGNYISDPVFREGLEAPPEQDMIPSILKWQGLFSEPAHTWNDLAYLRTCTSLPIVLKGILHPEDALKAVEYGVDGIIVSNHGGRQVDGSVGALTMLPEVVDAVNGRLSVLFDSGIRRGADIFKAVALGADAVLLGRPYMWGLAAGGHEGVSDVIRRILADFDLTCALAGCKNLSEITRAMLRQS